MLVKYLFKYISKGAYRIRYSITATNSSETPSDNIDDCSINEVQRFVDGRFICPHEAAWRILNFEIHQRNPAVQVLAVHLQGKQNITFNNKKRLAEIVTNPCTIKTTLTEWLKKNQIDADGRHLRYIDYLSEYRWDTSSKS
jgi:hypothetical protein